MCLHQSIPFVIHKQSQWNLKENMRERSVQALSYISLIFISNEEYTYVTSNVRFGEQIYVIDWSNQYRWSLASRFRGKISECGHLSNELYCSYCTGIFNNMLFKSRHLSSKPNCICHTSVAQIPCPTGMFAIAKLDCILTHRSFAIFQTR